MSKKIIGVTVGTSISPSKIKEKLNLSDYATEEFVKNSIARAQLEGAEVDLSGYMQQSELPAAIDTALEQAKSSGEFNGQDGRTPVKGTDYWTQDDITEIKSYVDEAILGGAW